MKILFLTLSLILGCRCVCRTNDTINRFDSKGRKIGTWGEMSWFEGDSLKTVCSYKAGKLNGKSTTYYPSGQIESTSLFEDGEKNGIARCFYKNGVISQIFIIENGKTSYYIKFDPQGRIFQETGEGKMIQYIEGKPLVKP